MKTITALLFILCTGSAFCQNRTLSGYVQDIDNGEKIIGAALSLTNAKQGTSTNKFGFFSLSVPSSCQIEISHLGYERQKKTLSLKKDTLIVFSIKAGTNQLKEVVIKAEQPTKDSFEESSMGRYNISVATIKKTPALLGEGDLLKTIQLLPGVQAGSEGTVGLNVRGSTPDHNLVLLDGISVYNINHLFGFLSVINSDAVANAEFLKSSMPARYGGRLSSVLDIRLREGNLKKWQTTIGLSPVASKLTVEGPLVKNKSSVLIAVRRTWLDQLTKLGSTITKTDNLNTIGFYDANLKWNYIFSNKDRLYLSFYTGQDKLKNTFSLSESKYSYGFNWGNETVGLRWNHLFSEKLFGNLLVNYTNFSYKLEDKLMANLSKKSYTNQVSSGIRDIGLKYDFEYYPSNNQSVKYGIGLVHHSFNPEIKQFINASSDTTIAPSAKIKTFEGSLYIEDDIAITSKLKTNVGIHYANQLVKGTTYHAFQPRISARFLVGKSSALKVSYTNTTQFLHLLTNSSAGLPTDLWVPVTKNIPPESAQNFSLGYSSSKGNYMFSVETYYKTLTNVLEYQEGTNFLSNPNITWEDRVGIGNATSYGAEFFLEKTKGRFTGWLSYTLSKTDRTFSDINQGLPFPFKYDRRHNISINASYDFNARRSLSATFVYTTGMAVTLPAGRFAGPSPDNSNFASVGGRLVYKDYLQTLPDYNGRNAFRAPSYHRLDISYKTTKEKKVGKRTWLFGVYNVYSRQNPFFLFYEDKQLFQFSLLPILPSFTYSREF